MRVHPALLYPKYKQIGTDMATTTERYEAGKRRDVRHMTKTELAQFSAMLHTIARTVDEALRYERTHEKHPVALRYEEQASDQFDAAIMYLANLRMRVEPGPTMNADGEISR